MSHIILQTLEKKEEEVSSEEEEGEKKKTKQRGRRSTMRKSLKRQGFHSGRQDNNHVCDVFLFQSSVKYVCVLCVFKRKPTTSCPTLTTVRILAQTVMTIWMRLFTDAKLQSHKWQDEWIWILHALRTGWMADYSFGQLSLLYKTHGIPFTIRLDTIYIRHSLYIHKWSATLW